MNLVLATNNPHKASELQQMMAEFSDLCSLKVLTLQCFPALNDPPETCNSFEGNALQKAHFVLEHLRQNTPENLGGQPYIVIADDSGLVVNALDGAPGVHSKRYTPEATAAANNAKLLSELDGISLNERRAHFVCVLAILSVNKDGSVLSDVIKAKCDGFITLSAKGENGFGYDPIFMPSEELTNPLNQDSVPRHMSELTATEKNAISHRGRAMQQLPSILSRHLGTEA